MVRRDRWHVHMRRLSIDLEYFTKFLFLDIRKKNEFEIRFIRGFFKSAKESGTFSFVKLSTSTVE